MSTSVSGTSSSSSTTATSTPTTVGGVTRYSGLASGLDIDSIVKGMMTSDQSKIDIQQQKLQSVQWKQTAYQSVTTELQDFQSKYLEMLSGSSSMIKDSNLQNYTGTSSNDVLSVSGTNGVQLGNHVVNIYQSAVTNSVTGSTITPTITGTTSISTPALAGTSFNINIDGVTKNIAFSSTDNFTDMAALISGKLKTAFGADVSGNCKVIASVDTNGLLSIKPNTTNGANYTASIAISSPKSNSALPALGILSGSTNVANQNYGLQQLLGNKLTNTSPDGSFKVNINGTDISLSANDTLAQTLQKINGANAGVTASYNKLTDSVSFTATQGGATGAINLTDTSNTGFFDDILGAQSSRTVVAGKDAIISLDGIKVTRDSNNFTVNGINITINQTVAGTTTPQVANVSIKNNSDSTVTTISNFVDAYNKVVADLNNLVGQKPDPNYKPLTDAQKATMTTDEVTKWNTKAQTGVLFGDSTVTTILSKMRSMLDASVTTSNGKTITLNDIGIATGTYSENGQLHIDTTKLNSALQNNPDDVMQLFTKSSSTVYEMPGSDNYTAAAQKQRHDDEGVSFRLQDLINDATGYGGSLLQIAGMPTDTTTQFDNTLYKQLKQINESITDLQTQFKTDQTRYYDQFTKLETFISQMNSQSAQLTSMLSSSGG
jgi:flagellar hook-associated protein 2